MDEEHLIRRHRAGARISAASAALLESILMNTDCAYVIGASHQVCQDYARAGEGYVILSDGCSSSPDTDIGARLLVVTAEKKMSEAFAEDGKTSWAERVGCEAATRANELHLPPRCLDATLIVARVRDETISVSMIGDGAVAWETRAGVLEMRVYSYSENRPLYMSYFAVAGRKAEWQATDPQLHVSRRRDQCWEEMRETWGEVQNSLLRIPKKDCRFVAVFSDGVGSFTERTESGETRAVAIEDVIRELVDFKSFKGAFAQRRMNAFLKPCATRGWKHHDDLSMAVIASGDD